MPAVSMRIASLNVRRVVEPRALLLPVGIATLLAGIAGGIARFGIFATVAPDAAVAWHGPLILFGFLGLLVSLERAVALRRPWAFAGPSLAGIGTVALLAGVDPRFVAMAWTGTAVIAALAVRALHRREPSLALKVMLASCAAWIAGTALWGVGASLATLVPWWSTFLVLMILGERIQFGKLYYLDHAARVVTTLAAMLLAAALLGIAMPAPAMGLAGAALLVLGAWLLVADVSRRARRAGLLWYVSVGLACAYAWLALAGALWVASSIAGPGVHSDASIHALFQGFVMGMVFAHAPMIFPAVTGLRMPFHRGFHVPLALLHVGMAGRCAGDLFSRNELARIGATTSAAALVAFVLLAALGVRARRS